jgi:hypothetical protein
LDKGNAYSGNDDAVTLGVASVVNDLGWDFVEWNYSA